MDKYHHVILFWEERLLGLFPKNQAGRSTIEPYLCRKQTRPIHSRPGKNTSFRSHGIPVRRFGQPWALHPPYGILYLLIRKEC